MACTKNPIIEYVNYIIQLHSENPSKSFTEYMQGDSFKDFGTIEEGVICCPDCGPISFIGPAYDSNGSDIFKDLFSNISPAIPNGCCENYDINVSDNLLVNQSNKNYNSIVCCNDFSNCSETFNNLMQQYLFSNPEGFFGIYNRGIHEYDTFNNNTTLCELNTAIQSLNTEDKIGFLEAMFQLKGFVSYCNPNDGFIYAGTVEGMLNWW